MARIYLLTLLLACPLAAAGPAETALSKVPADVDYFSTTLRTGETIEAIGNSNAWKLVWTDPIVQDLRKKAFEGLGNKDLAPLVKFFADPANAPIPGLAADAVSNEVFVMTRDGTGEMLATLQEFIGVARYGPAFAQLQGGRVDDRERARMLLALLAEKPERVKGPDVMIGFKLSKPDDVAAQLKRLDPLLAEALKDTPMKGRSERVKVDGDEFLTLSIDGSIFPLDDIRWDQFEQKDNEFQPLVKHLKKLKLTISLGVRQGYLLLVFGRDVNAVKAFGTKGETLASRKELAPVVKAAEKPLLSCGYVSAKLRQATATTADDVQGMADTAKGVLSLAMLPDEHVKAIEKDIDALAKSAIAGIVKPEASVSYSIRTKQGWESFDYDYTSVKENSSKPLTLLNHVGGNPILAVVGRSGTDLDDHKAMVKWISIFAGHIEKVMRDKVPDSGEYWDKIHKDLYPILHKLNAITETQFIPSLDGQTALVFDAKWTSDRWHQELPNTPKAMPLPEFGAVVGVTDANKLSTALEGYRVNLNDFYAKVREMFPDSPPAFEIPKPKSEDVKGLTLAWYPLPKEWGADAQVQPTAGLSKSVAGLALSRGHIVRLLEPTPLKTKLAPFADEKKPLDSVTVFNFAEMMSAVELWVNFAVRQAPRDVQADADRIAPKVMAILKVFQNYGSATWRENGITITHSEGVYRDVPK